VLGELARRDVARTLKPMTTAFDASARLMSDSVMPPTPACTMLTLTSPVEASSSLRQAS
jgi:hypothetical protein